MSNESREDYRNDLIYRQGSLVSEDTQTQKHLDRIRNAMKNPAVASLHMAEIGWLLHVAEQARDSLRGLKRLVEATDFPNRVTGNIASCIQGACNRAGMPCVLSPELWGLNAEDAAAVREVEAKMKAV